MSVITLTATQPTIDCRLDALALRLAGRCLVEELIDNGQIAATWSETEVP